jgi:hypothetical protein
MISSPYTWSFVIYVLYSMSLVIDGTIKNRFKKIPLYANQEIVKFHITNRYREFNRYITWTTGHFWNRFFEVHYFVDLSLPGIALSSNLAVLQCHPSTNLNNRTFLNMPSNCSKPILFNSKNSRHDWGNFKPWVYCLFSLVRAKEINDQS